MVQKDKELLLKDLCSRFPYGVKCAIVDKDLGFGGIPGFEGKYPFVIDGITQEGDDIDVWVEHGNFSLETVKPYLFPLSSMTDEQRQEYTYIVNYISPDDTDNWKEGEFIYVEQFAQLMHFYHINHLDYMGLIEEELAIDATGKNIY